jgi:SnoaL-like domain
MADAAQAAATYFDAWKNRDFDRVRSVLADDATFAGPLGTAGDGDACCEGLKGLSQIVTDIVIRKTLADDADVMTWFELHTKVAPPADVVNWSHVADGRIDRIRVTFDARDLAPPAASDGD